MPATSAAKYSRLFQPGSTQPFKLSRSKIELFMGCARCFYLDRRLGIGRPSGPPFSLNSAVDTLLKKEFDVHRAGGTAHPLMKAYAIDAVPYQHPLMNMWRENFKGIQHHHEPSNFLITGAVDDVWVNPKNQLIIVDYKATAKNAEVSLDADWQISYKRQMEIYQWLFRMNGFEVAETGYFVYCNGSLDKEAFDGKLEFRVKVIPYTGNTDWISDTLMDIRECLESEDLPYWGEECEFCGYRQKAKAIE
jgi:hypothetical protein